MRARASATERDRLLVIKELVSSGDYRFSSHVQELIGDGFYTSDDPVECVMSAKVIHRLEPDGMAADGYKYEIKGRDSEGEPFYTCGKIVLTSRNCRLYLFITARQDSDR